MAVHSLRPKAVGVNLNCSLKSRNLALSCFNKDMATAIASAAKTDKTVGRIAWQRQFVLAHLYGVNFHCVGTWSHSQGEPLAPPGPTFCGTDIPAGRPHYYGSPFSILCQFVSPISSFPYFKRRVKKGSRCSTTPRQHCNMPRNHLSFVAFDPQGRNSSTLSLL